MALAGPGRPPEWLASHHINKIKLKAKQTARKGTKWKHENRRDKEDKTRERKKRREVIMSASWLIITDKIKIKEVNNIQNSRSGMQKLARKSLTNEKNLERTWLKYCSNFTIKKTT